MKLALILCTLMAAVFNSPGETTGAQPNREKSDRPEIDLSKFKLTFSDEFEGDQLDATKWQAPEMPRQGSSRWVKSLATVRDGALHLGIRLTEDPVLRYDCAAVRTRRDYDPSKTMFQQRYGYFEARAKLPKNLKADYWAAFWMMCGNVNSADTRDGLETDILESFPLAYKTKVALAFHWNGYGEKHNSTGVELAPTPELRDGEFHRYGLYWDEHVYVAFYDGKEIGRTDLIGLGKSDGGKTQSQGPCQKPGYLKLSCEAAPWAGATDKWEKEPTKEDEFVVDYVRVYEGTLPAPVAEAVPLPKLKVSDSHRFLVNESGQPFFWLADTAWELFHRLNREDAERYLMNRAKLGFNVVQAVALAEFNGLTAPNAYGHLPLNNNDPLQPNEEYFKHVDWIVAKANSLGIYVGFLPTWGDKWNKKWGAGPEVFTPQNAEAYGEWLAKRYKDAGIVWILGGDRPVENDAHKEIIRAMARGLRKGDGGTHLITFHPTGGSGSSVPFHNEEWLDFNMRQNGHVAEFTGRFEQTRADYDRTPIKPVLDGEPIYEGHPVSFDAKKFGHSVAADIRRAFYWDVFTGACGHTYGHHSVWAMHSAKQAPVNSPLMPWTDAINEPGAAQVGIGRQLIESRPFLTRVPDDSVLVTSEYPTLVPGAGTRRFAATRDSAGSCAMVYVPVGRTFTVRMDKISGSQVKAWWFNPRDGTATAFGTFENKGEKLFTPPTPGELLDWVLVLDDAAKGYPQPGARASKP